MTPAFPTTCFVATCTPLRLPAAGSPVTSPAGLSRSGDTHVSPTTWQACRGALRGWLTSPGGGRAVPPDKPWVGATSGSCWARPASQAEAAGACAGGWLPSSPLCPRAPCVPGRRRAPGAPGETRSPLFPPRHRRKLVQRRRGAETGKVRGGRADDTLLPAPGGPPPGSSGPPGTSTKCPPGPARTSGRRILRRGVCGGDWEEEETEGGLSAPSPLPLLRSLPSPITFVYSSF